MVLGKQLRKTAIAKYFLVKEFQMIELDKKIKDLEEKFQECKVQTKHM